MHRGRKKGTPLSFIAQFNMEELREFDLDNMLPKKGILYFFMTYMKSLLVAWQKKETEQKSFFMTEIGSN